MKNIATALVKAQGEMSNPKKGNTNPFFKSKYADLNAVREAVIPTLNDNGIVVLQPIMSKDGKNYVNTILMHESGEFLESFTEIVFSKQNDAQAQGSGITYARRYGLQSFVCVGADDDDGNKAIQPAKETVRVVDLTPQFDNCKTLEELGTLWINIPKSDKEKYESKKNLIKEKLTLKTA